MWRQTITHAEQHPNTRLTYTLNFFCLFNLFVSIVRTHFTSYEPCRLVNSRFPYESQNPVKLSSRRDFQRRATALAGTSLVRMFTYPCMSLDFTVYSFAAVTPLCCNTCANLPGEMSAGQIHLSATVQLISYEITTNLLTRNLKVVVCYNSKVHFTYIL